MYKHIAYLINFNQFFFKQKSFCTLNELIKVLLKKKRSTAYHVFK